MKRLFVSLVALTVFSIAGAGFAAKTAAVKAPANPLIGEWSAMNDGSGIDVIFTATTATFITYNNASGDEIKFVSNYKYGKSPITFKFKGGRGSSTIPVTMTYKIAGDKLTYRFTKVGEGMERGIYLNRMEGKPADVECTKKAPKEEKVIDPNGGK